MTQATNPKIEIGNVVVTKGPIGGPAMLRVGDRIEFTHDGDSHAAMALTAVAIYLLTRPEPPPPPPPPVY